MERPGGDRFVFKPSSLLPETDQEEVYASFIIDLKPKFWVNTKLFSTESSSPTDYEMKPLPEAQVVFKLPRS